MIRDLVAHGIFRLAPALRSTCTSLARVSRNESPPSSERGLKWLILFDVNCFLLVGEELFCPAELRFGGVIPIVVLIGGKNLDFGGFGGVVFDGKMRPKVHVLIARLDFPFDGIEDFLLLLGRKRVPKCLGLFFVETRHSTTIFK